jgi:methionyl-tRNA synthetase
LAKDVAGRYDSLMLDVGLTPALAAVWELVGRANLYLVERAPWRLAKDPASRDELAGVLYAAAEILRILAVLLSPIMPGAAGRLWKQLGISEPLAAQRIPHAAEWGRLTPGTRTTKGESLFPRLDS